MPQSYTPEFKKKIVRLHEEEKRTYKSITAEYGVSKASISKWYREFSKECLSIPEAKAEYDNMKELLKLKRENEELRKENLSILSRLVDTFISKISLTMLLVPKSHNTVYVLTWVEDLRLRSRFSGCSNN